MKSKQLIGIVLIVVGLGLAYWGYQESRTLGSQLTEASSGSPTNNVMIKYVGGAAAVLARIFLARSG